nr:hypothetical protein Iba_chr01eCG8980 [Ipomoea batatas]GMD31112.1 hypothetical protein Iba_scaffold43627CG0010 [Ipomoea batatas]GMD88232.1 hypothetical protein Iba_scaffold382954CG0010 [Ipomoea batatas]GME03343.1 hypothetical protein Iba_scaffold665CG0320 [Ipomoea batatas]
MAAVDDSSPDLQRVVYRRGSRVLTRKLVSSSPEFVFVFVLHQSKVSSLGESDFTNLKSPSDPIRSLGFSEIAAGLAAKPSPQAYCETVIQFSHGLGGTTVLGWVLQKSHPLSPLN